MDDDRVMHAMSIDDMYHVERVLARGVAGVTELVTIEGSGPFVRKKISLAHANRGVWTACAECGNKRLPRVEATYELPDEFVVVYDYVPGDSVEKVVRSARHLPVGEAVSLARDVCEAAGALHACGIVHRDIAPTNVIVAADGAHLIDLGIARLHKDGATRDDDALGTWGFAAPEQYGFAPTDPRSDVYAIGRVLAYMATGVAPSDEGFDAALGDAALVPPALRAVIDKACAFEPSARHQTAEELSQALEAALAGEGAEPRREPSAQGDDGGRKADGPEGNRRHRRALAIVLVAIVAVVAIGIGAYLLGHSGSDSPAAGDSPADATDAADASGASSTGNTATSSDAPDASSTANTGSTNDTDDMVQLTSLEWGVASDGDVIFLVGLTNTSDSLAADYSTVTITGCDANGTITFSHELTFPRMRPGDTLHMAEFASGTGQTVDVSAKVTVPDSGTSRWTGTTGQLFDVSRVSYFRDELGRSVLTGVITTLEDLGDGDSMVRVDAVLRDANGNIVGYSTAYPNRPAVGQRMSFQTLTIEDSDDVESYDIYVSP